MRALSHLPSFFFVVPIPGRMYLEHTLVLVVEVHLVARPLSYGVSGLIFVSVLHLLHTPEPTFLLFPGRMGTPSLFLLVSWWK